MSNSTIQLNNVQVERGEDGMVTLQIEVAPEAVQQVRERVIKDYSRRIRVAGFRPGKVPANIVRRNVGDESIAQTVSDEIVPQAYQAALEQSELRPLDRAEVDQLTFDAFDGDKPLNFTARVTVRPEIELGDIKNLDAAIVPVDVTDEDVERGLEELRAQRATLKDIEGRGAQNGDVVSAELRVFLEEKETGDEPSRLRGFILGESGFVPSIDEHLLDAKLDEERRFPVQYPDDFKDAELAGKSAEFAIKITSLKERVLPELDDEFAVQLQLENVAAVRERMQEAILEGRERENTEAMRAKLVEAAVAAAQFETPQSMVHARAHRRLENLERELEQRGATLDQYLAGTEKTREEFSDEVHAEVEKELRQELVLDEIATREEIVASQQELENHYYQVAAAMSQPVEKIAETLDIETARASVLQRKAVDFLVEHANIVESDTSSEQPSADSAATETAVTETETTE